MYQSCRWGCSTIFWAWHAGPVSGAHLVSLSLCVNAVEATGQVAVSDLQRLEETLYALRTLAYLQPNIRQVSTNEIPRVLLPHRFVTGQRIRNGVPDRAQYETRSHAC